MPSNKSKKSKKIRITSNVKGSNTPEKDSEDWRSLLDWMEKEVWVSGQISQTKILTQNYQKRKAGLLTNASVYLMGETKKVGNVWIASNDIHDLPTNTIVRFKAKITNSALTEYKKPVKGVGFYHINELAVRGLITKEGDDFGNEDYFPMPPEDIQKGDDFLARITRHFRKKLQEILPVENDVETHMKNPLIMKYLEVTARWYETD